MIVHECKPGALHPLRVGIPTGSGFSNLVTSTGGKSKSLAEYALVLAAEKYAGKTVDGFGGNKYTNRGKELEPEAKADYEFEHQVEVEDAGFITDNLMRYGVSPDGVVGKEGMTEFKCLIAKEHIKVLLHYEQYGTTPGEYVAQTQGELLVAGRKWNDLRFYHPDLPGLTIRQFPDWLFFKMLRSQLKAVIVERNLILEKLAAM